MFKKITPVYTIQQPVPKHAIYLKMYFVNTRTLSNNKYLYIILKPLET